MKTHIRTLAKIVAAAAISLTVPLAAYASGDHGKMGMNHGKAAAPVATATTAAATAPSMTDGEIRKIDKENNKITIKHGEIKHMDMPPMTMVFTAKDKAMLDKVKVGEKIQFVVVQDAGKMTVTDIQPMK
ncbi:copper-binding protein [Polaromonas sp. YR568]|uniref:copper-binding protein n=1 Tax=Polaromonas sp. YR568 TaxID=1855301 RepID=UPI0031384289